MDVKDIYASIDELTAQLEIMTAKLEEAVKLAVKDAAKANPNKLNRISEHIFTIQYSQLIGKPWSPSFYDWNASAEFIIDYLKNKPCTDWKKILQYKLEKPTGEVVYFDKTTGSGYWKTTIKIPIDKRFIEKIISNL